MDFMPEKAQGVMFQDPIGELEVKRIMDGFVDDTTAWFNMFKESLRELERERPTADDIVDGLYATAKWWEELLNASGGKLELSKCFFYIIAWIFDKEGKVRLATGEEMNNPKIELRQSEDGSVESITFKESTETHLTLGAQLDPWSTSKAEYERLLKKGRDLGRKFSSGPMNTRSAIKAYQIHLASMGYTLPVTSFTKTELEKIQTAPVKALKGPLGFNRSMPNAVIYGPSHRCGAGLKHLYSVQGTRQTLLLLTQYREQHARMNSLARTSNTAHDMGLTLKILLRWTQLMVGTTWPWFSDNRHKLPHLEGNWLIAMYEHLKATNCTLFLAGIEGVKLRRVNDRALMDDALSGRYKDADVEAINRVRMYLRVETLADICNAAGTQLEKTVREKDPSVSSRSTIDWPNQGKPGPKTMKAWRDFLLREYLRDEKSGALRQGMGSWISTHHRQWPAYYDHENEQLAIRKKTRKYAFHNSMSGRALHQYEEIECTEDDAPTDGTPVDLLSDRNHSLPFGWYSEPGNSNKNTAAKQLSFKGFIATLEPWERDLLSKWEINEDAMCSLQEALISKEKIQILFVSDGGSKEHYGSFGWLIGTATEILARGRGTARGFPMQSFRAEAYGRLAVFRFILRFIEFYGLCKSNKCRIRTYCDNSGMLVKEEQRIQREWDEVTFWKEGDSDVIDLLAKTREDLPRISTEHIKGHQDDDMEYDELPRPAQLNVLADELATLALNEAHESSRGQAPNMIPLPNCGAYLIHNGQYQTSKEEQLLQFAIHEKEMDDYLRERNEWTQDTVEGIDWTAHHRALKRVDWNKKVFILKLSHRWLPTGTKMLTWKKQSHDECKLCKTSEIYDHLFLCPQRGIWRAEFLDKLRKHLDGFRTAADIRTTIMKNVKGWLNGDTKPMEHSVQDGIGWRGFIRGYISVEFSEMQERFYRDQHLCVRDFSGVLWSQRLIEFLWREAHCLWKARNKQVHDEDGHKQSARELEEARIKI